jgi:hypothetical protein
MLKTKFEDAAGIAALVFAMLGTLSVFIWQSRTILFLFIGLAVVCFGLKILLVLRRLSQREREEARRLKRRLKWFYDHPEKTAQENPCTKNIYVPPPIQAADPLDDERIRTRLFGQRGLAMAESAAAGERDNACVLYNRELQQYHLTDDDVAERFEKEKGKRI